MDIAPFTVIVPFSALPELFSSFTGPLLISVEPVLVLPMLPRIGIMPMPPAFTRTKPLPVIGPPAAQALPPPLSMMSVLPLRSTGREKPPLVQWVWVTPTKRAVLSAATTTSILTPALGLAGSKG